MSKLNSNIIKYAFYGFFFGLSFPLTAWSFQILSGKYSFSLEQIKLIHTDNPLNFIIDLAPFVLAVVAFFISEKVGKVQLYLFDEIKNQKEIISQYSQFAEEIGKDNFNPEKTPTFQNTKTNKSLLLLKKNFIAKYKEEQEISGISKGKELITDILRKHNDLNLLIKDILINIIEYTKSIQGSFYLYSEDKQELQNVFSYAYEREKKINQRFKIGQGLIGQAAYEKNYIYRQNIPEDYFSISSGLIGTKKPGVILILPLTGDEKIQGVIEIASLQKEYPKSTISLLTELEEIIGQTLFNFKANERTKKLLDEAQKLTNKLQKNENDLRENAKQMELTQIELEKSNKELAAKIFEVETGQKRIHALLENASEVITIYDTKGIVQYVSPSVKNILGFNPEEMLGINRFERGGNVLQNAFNELIIKPDSEKIVEYQYINKNEEKVWLETRGRNLSDNPAIGGIIFNTRDITVRKDAETAKRLSSEMQALSENSLDMIIRVGQTGNFFYANPMTEKFIGKANNELIGRNINTAELNQEVADFFNEIIKKTNVAGVEIQEETIFNINNTKRIVQFNSIPETDDNGEIITFLFVVHDITQSKEIEQEIEKKNKNITESINYAQRIQSTIVPDFKIVKRYLPKSFMFYKPRDVVSGDLPWFYVTENEIYIAAIDCTGHGVPGTLLSFIGYFSLNSIVNEDENQTAGEILDKLHFRVRRTLKQDSPDSKARDGMDIALCKINYKENILEYAGAHNPLLLLRGSEISRFKGDRMAVGGKPMRGRPEQKEKKFTTHKINIEKNDKIFIFTDGFPDQIGGKDGRKYQAGRMQKEIIENKNFTMNQFYDFFVTQFDEWKKNYKQIDDVLFLGIEF